MPDMFVIRSFRLQLPAELRGQPYFPTREHEYSLPYVLPLGQGDGLNTHLPLGTGVYGASYTAAAGIYKNISAVHTAGRLRWHRQRRRLGWSMTIAEGIASPPINRRSSRQCQPAQSQARTALAEMLYALLVEGRGPLGSVFSPDDFTTKEVQDTDGDGLPEFVDAWGQPLQFFRWPLLYHSDIQRGQVITTHGDCRLRHRLAVECALHAPCSRPASRTRSTPTSN